jgi:hypothetical protein
MLAFLSATKKPTCCVNESILQVARHRTPATLPGRKENEMKRNVVVAAYVLVIEGDIEPKLHGPYKSPDVRDRAAKRLRAKDEERKNGIFVLDLMKNGKVHVWGYSAGFLDGTSEARDEDQAEEIDAPSEPLKSIDRPGPRKDARNALRKFGE